MSADDPDTSTKGDFDFQRAVDALEITNTPDAIQTIPFGGLGGLDGQSPGEGSDPAPAPAPAPGPEPEPPQDVPISEARKRELLEQHNCHRRRFGLNPLRWDDSLAQAAHAHAKKCEFKHSDRDKGVGENLSRATRGTTDAAGWIAEEPQFRCGSTVQRTAGRAPPYGHWTQMVWPSTTAVGCGVAKCGNGEILVCQYKPAGNVIGQKPLTEAQCRRARESDIQCPYQQGAPSPPSPDDDAQPPTTATRQEDADRQVKASKRVSDRDGLTAQERSTILEMHNRARAEVGAPPLVWDATLSGAAAEYAAICDDPFRHWSDSGKPRPCFRYDPNNPTAPVGAETARITGRRAATRNCMPMGENLYHGQCSDPVRTAMKLWYDEIACSVCGTYQGEKGSCVPQGSGPQPCGREKCAICGHYSQMVWKTTRRIGCAKKKCPSGNDYLVCEYFPGGNVAGHLPFDCSYCEGLKDKFHSVVECRADLPVGERRVSDRRAQQPGGEGVRRLFPGTRGPTTEPPVAPTPMPRMGQPPVAQPAPTQPPVAQPAPTQPPVAQPPITQPPVAQPPVAQPPPTPAATPAEAVARAVVAREEEEEEEDEVVAPIAVQTDPGVLVTPTADEDAADEEDDVGGGPTVVEEPPPIVPAAAPVVVPAPSEEEVREAQRVQQTARTEVEGVQKQRVEKEEEATSVAAEVEEARREEQEAKAATEQALVRERNVSKRRGDPQLLIRLQRERADAEHRQNEARRRREEAEKTLQALQTDVDVLKEQEQVARQRLSDAEQHVDQLEEQTQDAVREQEQVDSDRAAAEREGYADRGSPGWTIALGVLGALVLIGLLAFGAYVLYRTQKENKQQAFTTPYPTTEETIAETAPVAEAVSEEPVGDPELAALL